MSKRRRGSAAEAAPINDIEVARARADAAIQAAAAPLSPEAQVIDLQRRLDRWVNYATGLGTLEDKTRAASFEPPWRLSDAEITGLVNGNDLAAKCVEKRPDEMFRRGYALEGQKPGEIEKGELDEMSAYATEDLHADARLHEAMTYGRQYGGALNLLGINDGRQMHEPVDEDNIQSIDFINTIDRRFAYVTSYYSNLDEPSLGEPELYLVANAVATSSYRSSDGSRSGLRTRTPDQIKRASPGASVLMVHESRTFRWDGVRPDVLTRQTLAGWSWSNLQRCYEILRMCDGSFDALAYLISDASQGVLKLKGLFQAISGGKEKQLQQRIDTLDRLKSVMHTIALDADGQESFERTTTSFAQLPEAIDRIMQRLASAMDMPVTELFGISPAGLNATGEGDRIHWYDTIATEQTKHLQPRLKRLYHLIALAKDGPFKGKGAAVKIKFHPLYAPTDSELAKTRLANAQRDEIYVNAEAVTAQQVTLTLTEVYPSIDVDEIEDAIDAKVAFDPLENDELQSQEAQATKQKAELAAKKPPPGFPPHGAPAGGAAVPTQKGARPASTPTDRESTPEKAQGKTPPKAEKKADETHEHFDKWNPEQPRDEHGRWSEEEAVSASRNATETSRFAMVFGGHEEHSEAAKAHAHAAASAHQLAAKHAALGNTKAAAKFTALATHHEALSASHATEAERTKPAAEPPPKRIISKAVSARARGGTKAHETRGERDEAAKVNIPAHLHSLWDETKAQFKGSPEERAEKFMEHAEAHPHEAARSLQASSDARLEDLIHEYESRRHDAADNMAEKGHALLAKHGEGSTLPRGVVSAGAFPQSRQLVNAAQPATRIQRLREAVNAPPSPLAYDMDTAKDVSAMANDRTAEMRADPEPEKIRTHEHLAAAKDHMGAAHALRSAGVDKDQIHAHVAQAKEHAEAAGPGYWEEDKHPRDEHGRFDAFNPDQPRDPSGKWGEGAGHANMLTGRALNRGGFSYRPGAKAPKTGYMVSLPTSAGLNSVIEIASLAQHETKAELRADIAARVQTWLKTSLPAARAAPEHYLGGWVQTDKATGKLIALHLDVSQRFTDREQALAAGRERNQLAVWHLDEGKEVSTGGTGT